MFGAGLSGKSICSQKNCRNIQGKKNKTLFDRRHLANPTGRKRTSSGLAEGPQEKERKNEQQLPGSTQEASQGHRQAFIIYFYEIKHNTAAHPLQTRLPSGKRRAQACFLDLEVWSACGHHRHTDRSCLHDTSVQHQVGPTQGSKELCPHGGQVRL